MGDTIRDPRGSMRGRPVRVLRDARLAFVMRDALEGVRELAFAAACPRPAPPPPRPRVTGAR